MQDPRSRQTSFNTSSRDQWTTFSSHRQKVTNLLVTSSNRPQSRLCVLGAGNANDLDLQSLLAVHREVHLVDLDSEALAQAAQRQQVARHPALHLAGGVDLTAILDTIQTWSPSTSIRTETLQSLAEAPAARVPLALQAPFDLVASTCLLSQLIGNAFHALSDRHPQFLAVVQAIRAGHLRLLTSLTAPGGVAILITDLASSNTFAPLASLPESSFPSLLPDLARRRAFIHGVDPAVILPLLRLNPSIASLESVTPWLWQLHTRRYLVWAVKCQIR